MRTTRIKKGIYSTIFLLFLVLQNSCIKEKFDISKFDATLNLQSGLAVPVGFSHLGFEKYLSETPVKDELRIGKDGFLSFYYSAAIDSGVMEQLFSINDISINKSILNNTGSVISLNKPGSTLDLTDSLTIMMTGSQANIRIDSVRLASGTLGLNVSSANLTGTVTFQINSLRKNGVPFTATLNLTNPNISLSLANYIIIPEHDLSGNNLVKCSISVHLQFPSGPVNPGAAIMNVTANMTVMNYETIYGNFGGYTINFPRQIIETSFFKQLTAGGIYFAEPKLKLFFTNSVGVPFGISFSNIDAIDINNVHHPLTGPGVPSVSNPKIIRYPALNQQGQTFSDSLIIDKTNSNLPDFFTAWPDSILINSSASVMNLIPPATTFMSHDSKYKISALIDLPLWGKADFIILLDTMDFNYLSSTLPPPDEIEKLIIRTSITNSFPVTAYPQIYLINSNNVITDSLFTGKEKLEGASDTNGDGIADPLKQAPIDIDLPRSRIDNLYNAKFLLIKGRIMTTDFPSLNVKFYSSYFLDYNVGIIAQLKIKTGK